MEALVNGMMIESDFNNLSDLSETEFELVKSEEVTSPDRLIKRSMQLP